LRFVDAFNAGLSETLPLVSFLMANVNTRIHTYAALFIPLMRRAVAGIHRAQVDNGENLGRKFSARPTASRVGAV
jgi:hypothetical protein